MIKVNPNFSTLVCLTLIFCLVNITWISWESNITLIEINEETETEEVSEFADSIAFELIEEKLILSTAILTLTYSTGIIFQKHATGHFEIVSPPPDLAS